MAWHPDQYRGRPTELDYEIADRIIEAVGNGASFTKLIDPYRRDDDNLADDIDYPTWTTWQRWMKQDADLARRFDEAKLFRADVLMEEVLELSDGADASRARVQIDARMRACEVADRAKYGRYSPTPTAPPTAPTRDNSGEELRRKLQQMQENMRKKVAKAAA